MNNVFDGLCVVKKANERVSAELENYYCGGARAYRKSKYVVETTFQEGVLLLNTITQQMLYFADKQYLVGFFETELAKNTWFAVPVDFDEFQFVQYYRKLYSNRYIKPFKFTIFTTLACNANCFYCFEKKNIGHMSKETADEVVDFIEKYADTERTIELAWFGGEPLLNTSIIDYICNKLENRRIRFFSTMTSNGLLIDEKLIGKAISSWNLKDIQITLDGTETNYNSIKRYNSYEGSAFEQVIENIKLLINQSIIVYIRLNMTATNNDDLSELVDFLVKKIGSSTHLRVYCSLLYEKTCGEKNDFIINNELLENQVNITHRLYNCGIFKIEVPSEIKVFNCNPDSGREITILPNGMIGWCEHYIFEKQIGSVKGDINKELVHRMQVQYKPVDLCKECSYFPYCIRLVVCDDCVDFCDDSRKRNKLDNLKIQMKTTFLQS